MISNTGHMVPIMFGEGASKNVGAKAKALGMTNVMIVCDKGVRGSGAVDPIAENIKQAGLNVYIFDGVLPDPPSTVVDEATAIAAKEKIDGFVAIGGGSSIDTAKSTNVCHKYGGPVSKWFGNYCMQKAYPLIAVPTTAGTGSEMTYGAVITVAETGVKTGIGGLAYFTDIAIVDPLLYVGMPLKPTVACAFDVYTHAIEAIIHPSPEPIADAMAEKALRYVHKFLPRLLKDTKDIEARAGMAIAATMAGCAINTSLCHNTHAIGHSLGAVFHLPHGLCCAVGLPRLMQIYGEKYPQQTRTVAEALGMHNLPENISPKELGEKVSAHVAAFIKSTGLQSLKELGIPREKLEEAIQLMPKDVTAVKSDYRFTLDEYRAIVLEAYDIG